MARRPAAIISATRSLEVLKELQVAELQRGNSLPVMCPYCLADFPKDAIRCPVCSTTGGYIFVVHDASYGYAYPSNYAGTGTYNTDWQFTTGCPTCVVSPASLKFAIQLVGTTSSAKTIKLTNSGTISLTISNIVASGDFSQTNNCPVTVAAGGNCTESRQHGLGDRDGDQHRGGYRPPGRADSRGA
jgi:hypothetical protein